MMVRAALLALALVALTVPVSAAIADGLAAPYLHIQLALANDSLDGVADAATTMAREATTMGDAARPIGTAAQAVSAASDITTARAAFGALSDALIAYGEKVGFGDLRVAYCPMARKSWLQTAGELRNPFYGSVMLNCGIFR